MIRAGEKVQTDVAGSRLWASQTGWGELKSRAFAGWAGASDVNGKAGPHSLMSWPPSLPAAFLVALMLPAFPSP